MGAWVSAMAIESGGRLAKNSWLGRQRCCGTRRDRVRNSADLSPSKARPERVARSDMSASGARGACASRASSQRLQDASPTRRHVHIYAVGTFGRYHMGRVAALAPCARCRDQGRVANASHCGGTPRLRHTFSKIQDPAWLSANTCSCIPPEKPGRLYRCPTIELEVLKTCCKRCGMIFEAHLVGF